MPGVTQVQAHDVTLTETSIVFHADGSFSVDLRYDVDAHLIQVRPEHLTDADLQKLQAMPPSHS